MTGAFDKVTGFLKSAYSTLSDLLGPLKATELQWRGWGYEAGAAVGRVIAAISELPSKVAAVASEFGAWVSKLAESGWSEVAAAIGRVGAAISDLPGKIVANATNFGSALTTLAKAGWNAMMNFDWAGLGKAIVQAIIEGISAMGSALASKLGEIASAGAAKIKGLFSFGGGSTPPAKPSPAPAIAGERAAGGPVMGGKTYLVGERGPELFRAPTSGEIVPNHRLQRLTAPETIAQATTSSRGGRGDVSIVNHWQITGATDPEAVGRIAEKRLNEVIRRMSDEQHGLLSD